MSSETRKNQALKLLKDYTKAIENGDILLNEISIERITKSYSMDGTTIQHYPTNNYVIRLDILDNIGWRQKKSLEELGYE